jgi:hypothetical protein
MFATQDQDNRRAGARALTRNHHGGVARRLRRAAAGAVCTAAVALPLIGAVSAQAATTATPTYTPLTLVNGWTNYGAGVANAAAANINGIVHLKGGITTPGTNAVPFTLPTADRPAARVYVPVDMCNGTNGRLDITPNGVATVEPEAGNWSNASCFTSLDGVTFAKSATSFTPLTLQNGWASYGGGTASPAARNISGIVYLKGAMYTPGTTQIAFTLPPADWPAAVVNVPVDLCNATGGQLEVTPSGLAVVYADVWSNASCFTSLDGVSFPTSTTSFTPLTLQNGWTSVAGVASPAVRKNSGIVHLEGAIQGGTNPAVFTLPAGDRPAHDVYVKVLFADSSNGRLFITPSGSVTLQGNLAETKLFTSLNGASFAV